MANIILADDDEGYCMVVRDFLIDRGHQVAVVYSATHLRALLLTVSPDLMIIDMHMPGGGGPAAMKSFRDLGINHKPVIVCSGMPAEHTTKWALDQGLTSARCFQKPPNFAEFGKAVDELLKPPPTAGA